MKEHNVWQAHSGGIVGNIYLCLSIFFTFHSLNMSSE